MEHVASGKVAEGEAPFEQVAGGKAAFEQIAVEVWLYGPLASYSGDSEAKSHDHLQLSLPVESRLVDLLEHLGLPTGKRGITFLNGKLSALPGLQPDLDYLLQNGDRVAFFHRKSMWPFQYRQGAALTQELAREIEGREHFHHCGR